MLAQIWANYINDNRCDNVLLFALNIRGRPRISERGFNCIKVCGSLCWFYLIFWISHENEIIWSQRGHIGFLKSGEGGSREPPEPHLDPPLNMFIFWYFTVNLNILLLHYLYEIKFKNLFNMSFLVHKPYWYIMHHTSLFPSSARQLVKNIFSPI